MAYIQTILQFPEYAYNMDVSLYFPTDLPEHVGNKVKGVITLLHGHSGTGRDWMHMTAACRYAADNGYILVAPSVGNSFYSDMAYGPAFYTIMTEKLPQALDTIYKIPSAREMNYICGLSMGGYGALRIGLSQPQRYAAVGSFSGVVDFKDLAQNAEITGHTAVAKDLRAVLGDACEVPDEYDIFHLGQQVEALPKAQQPRIFATCGTEDFLSPMNQRLKKEFGSMDLDFTYKEWPGVHEWNYWDRSLVEFIGFIQNSDYAQRKRNDWSNGGL